MADARLRRPACPHRAGPTRAGPQSDATRARSGSSGLPRSTRQPARARPSARRCKAERTAAEVGTSGWVSSSSTRKSASAAWRARRQRQPVGDRLRIVRAGDDVERQRQVGGAARHRADHREVDPGSADRAGVPGGALPRIGTRPCVGLCAKTPQKWAGTRSEPTRSEPNSKRHVARRQRRRAAARRAARRARQVPGIVGACRRPDCSTASPASCIATLVLPMTMAPAAFSRAHQHRVLGRGGWPVPGMPQVVGRPSTLKASLTVTGTPSSGRRSPRASAASAARAATRARSKSRTATALSAGSNCLMRAMECRQECGGRRSCRPAGRRLVRGWSWRGGGFPMGAGHLGAVRRTCCAFLRSCKVSGVEDRAKTAAQFLGLSAKSQGTRSVSVCQMPLLVVGGLRRQVRQMPRIGPVDDLDLRRAAPHRRCGCG